MVEVQPRLELMPSHVLEAIIDYAGWEHFTAISRMCIRLQDTTANPRVRDSHLTTLLRVLGDSFHRRLVGALRDLCCIRPQPDKSLIQRTLPLLRNGLYSKDEVVIADACAALAHISARASDGIQTVVDAGVCLRLTELPREIPRGDFIFCNRPPAFNPVIQAHALRTVGNIVCGTLSYP